MVLRESEDYPLPLFYPDGAGELLEPIETLELERMKKEIQRGVIYKIQHLLPKMEFLDDKDEKAKKHVVKASFHSDLSAFFTSLPQEMKDLPDVAKIAMKKFNVRIGLPLMHLELIMVNSKFSIKYGNGFIGMSMIDLAMNKN